MESADYLRFVLVLVFVLALIGVLTWLVRRFGLAGRMPTGGRRGRRLDVIEVAPLDSRHRLVLVRRDRIEHLILLGANADVVVERGIAPESAGRDEPAPHSAESAA
jgi:flagellar protein FliO/FliZ